VKSCVRDVMATPVVAVKKTASFKGMIVRMQKARVSAFPVINDDGRVIGVVSQADMLNREVGPDTPLAEAARLMRDHRVKRLPVTNATGHLIGIVSRADVLSVFTRSDADIRREAGEEAIAQSFLTDSRSLNVTVHDGIVTLTGCPETDQAGHDAVEAVRHVDGVIAVRDQLDYAGTPR